MLFVSSPVTKPPSLADRIVAARERELISQVELAELLGVATRSVQSWEAGARPKAYKSRRALEQWLRKVEAADESAA